MKVHLLYADADFDVSGALPPNRDDLIADLELGTLLASMAAGDKFVYEICTRVLLSSLTDPDAIRYRQSVLADCIDHPDVIREMYHLAVGALHDKRQVWGFWRSQNPSSVLSAAVRQLEVLIARVRQLRGIADEHAGAFGSDGVRAFFGAIHLELDDDYLGTLSRHLRQLRFPGGVPLSAELNRDNSGMNYVLRSGGSRRSWKERIGISPPTVYSFTIPPRDEAGANALSNIENRGINLVANAAAQAADHISSYFTMLRAELGFYVGCLNLRDELVSRSHPLTFPDPMPQNAGTLSCTDLRDACLCLRTDPVIGNDVDADGTQLLVITGANSGGKSTFLRSVGLAQLMMQAGMMVAARSLRASLCQGVFTHFIREEDPDLVSGRLDEELGRMSMIADQIGPGCLMLFNESFAATNEREGSEIGRQVATALLEAGVRVLFVTHHFDLADGFRRRDTHRTLFLRAPRQPDGRRDFKLVVAKPLPTSYGADIYYRIGGWLDEDGEEENRTEPRRVSGTDQQNGDLTGPGG
jgi:MutS domain V